MVKELLWSRASDSAEEAWKIDLENSQTCNAPEQILPEKSKMSGRL